MLLRLALFICVIGLLAGCSSGPSDDNRPANVVSETLVKSLEVPEASGDYLYWYVGDVPLGVKAWVEPSAIVIYSTDRSAGVYKIMWAKKERSDSYSVAVERTSKGFVVRTYERDTRHFGLEGKPEENIWSYPSEPVAKLEVVPDDKPLD